MTEGAERTFLICWAHRLAADPRVALINRHPALHGQSRAAVRMRPSRSRLAARGRVIAKFRVRRGGKKFRRVPPRTGSKLALSRQASLHMRTVRSKQTSGDSISAVKAAVPQNSPRRPIKPEKVPILFRGDFAFPSRPTLAETTSGFVWPNRHRRRGRRAACRLPNPGLHIKGIGGPPKRGY